MAKKIKLPLDMGNDVKVRTIEELKENYNTEKVVSYFLDGQLLTWLEERFYEEEAGKIKKISKDSPNISAEIAKAFEIEIQDEVDVEEIEERNERLNLLRQFTSDDEILKNVDLVAFSQEDMDIVHTSDIIYLCGDNFRIPYSVEGKTYIGVNSPSVDIKSNDKIDLQSKNITVKNCVFSEATLANMKSEEPAVEKSNSRSVLSKEFGALESEIISSDIEIEEGETLRFENKEIFIRADIECSGKIEFENCVIHYNESSSTKIIIISKSKIVINNCHLICHGDFSNAFISVDDENEIELCSIKANGTEFTESFLFDCDCGDQIIGSDVLTVEIKNCNLFNCVRFMILNENVESGDITIENCSIIQNDISDELIEYIDQIDDPEFYMFGSDCPDEDFDGSVSIKNITVYERENQIYKQHYFSLYHAHIESSAFINAMYCISGASVIYNCLFNNCQKVIDGLSVLNLSLIGTCQFINCSDYIIDGGFSETTIRNCDFYNLRIFSAEDYYESKTAIELGLASDISDCRFNGISASGKGSFLISCCCTPNDKKSLSPIAIQDCSFQNCMTHSGNGDIDDFIFNEEIRSTFRKKEFAINICDCEGLENLDKEGDTAEDYTIRYEDENGERIGCNMDIDSIMAEFA